NGGERVGVKHGKVNGNLRGHKVTMYEGGLKVPTLFYWKGKLHGGRVNDETMLTMDLLPTILELANIDYQGDKPFDGVSLASTVFEGTALTARDLFWMHRERLVMRRGDMKLIRSTRGNELFDLASDPREQVNLAKQAKYKSLVNTMVLASNNWQKNIATGFPATRTIGEPVKTVWPCKRDLKQFNQGKKYRWKNGVGVVE
ncbi:MAG: sulfatase-like hydrolase/transferase, partial [Colwellia sp.]|nr:sulfatase-like hydrolase/transferase [Colwellia sp.]